MLVIKKSSGRGQKIPVPCDSLIIFIYHLDFQVNILW